MTALRPLFAEDVTIVSAGRLVDKPLGSRGALSSRIARRSAARLGRVRRALGASALARALPQAGPLLTALSATLASLPPATRLRALLGPDLRGFLAEAETWIEVRRLAETILETGRRRRRAPLDRGGIRDGRRARLFDRVARTEHLAALVPGGRLDRGFARRSFRFAHRRLADALDDLSAFVLGLRLAHPRPGVLEVSLRFREDAEQGRPADRIDLGTLAGPAGPLGIAVAEANAARSTGRMRRAAQRPALVRATLRGGTLALRAPGGAEVIIPAAGSRLVAPDLESGRYGGPRLVRREMIPGTSILLAPVVESRPRRLRVKQQAAGLARRLARALRLVLVAWPEAHREISLRTWMVVPIHEPGTVSWSLAARPGISFINVFGKSLIDLADDLLHENSHHRLHDMQETADLLARGPDTQEVQAFDSPWRGTRRPLHGILHGAYTFQFRAELFRRIPRVARDHPRLLAAELGRSGLAFVRRELRREKRMLAFALRDLDRSARSGLLTPAGKQLLKGMRAWQAALRRPA